MYTIVYRLTVILTRTHFATSSWQEDRIGAGRLGALRLDILASNSTNDSSFLVYLKQESHGDMVTWWHKWHGDRLVSGVPGYQVMEIFSPGHLCLFWLEVALNSCLVSQPSVNRREKNRKQISPR